jgi:hypothetical protein
MKVEELRVGNWVYQGSQYGDMPINAYQIYQVELMESGGIVSDYYKEWKPIPLSIEILLQFGFAWENAKQQHLCWGVGNPNKISFSFTPLQIELGEMNCYAENSWQAIWEVRVKYLHQLQNIIFALTGNPLTPTNDGK